MSEYTPNQLWSVVRESDYRLRRQFKIPFKDKQLQKRHKLQVTVG
jgi:hypothetical protein